MMSSNKLLDHLLSQYEAKNPKGSSLKIGIDVLPAEERYFLDLGSEQNLQFTELANFEPQIIFKCTNILLNQIMSGDITGLTAVGRENMSDKTPLDIELGPQTTLTPDFMNDVYEFIQRFFNPTSPEYVIFDRSHARLVHGAWAVPMFYHTGFRSAWYQVEKGQSLNKPGDVNPFPQAFVILSGTGYAKIGENTISISAGRAYFIPPETEHILWTDEDKPVELIFLAWGENA
jgi:mannose-6-phosphate isomerase-like protein (cupin superfamily)